MFKSKLQLIICIIFAFTAILVAIITGVGIGLMTAYTRNIKASEFIGQYNPAIPTIILDAKGKKITEFFSEEKRDLVPVTQMPNHLVHALITREDQEFFEHNGFSIRGTLRAAWQIVTGQLFSGGSTITQQLAGQMYCNRKEISIRRKIKELWWAFQTERRYTKNQILELYLNKMPFGHGTYGVEAASQFYFRKPVKKITPAESVLLVIQLVSPGLYSPIRNPNKAKIVQQEILKQMVELSYLSKQEAEQAFNNYWDHYDPTRANRSVFFEREDKAPYFSEYIRGQLDDLLLGSSNIYTDGYVVHTTLDLDIQQKAESIMAEGLNRINENFQWDFVSKETQVSKEAEPIVEMLSLMFNIHQIKVGRGKQKYKARDYFLADISPVVEMTRLLFNNESLNDFSKKMFESRSALMQKTKVEGALICIENQTGNIVAMVGGSEFNPLNQFNRAMQAKLQPGSAFKPLYYAAAIDSLVITPSTLLYDGPYAFKNDDGTLYTPDNYGDAWKGNIRARIALANSMNIPSLKVLDRLGFDRAIEYSSELLGIYDPDEIFRTFPRKYPLGLGVISASPVQMAKAYLTFTNHGKTVHPFTIKQIEDRFGKTILNKQKQPLNDKDPNSVQILRPGTAYIMTDMLRSTVAFGTLHRSVEKAGKINTILAGKTGTTQNWADAWTVGFSPYYTVAIWFGFDQPGNSLGVWQTGATAAGPVWAEFMKTIHKDLPRKEFEKPQAEKKEVYWARICTKSGKWPTEQCEKTAKEIFLVGTGAGGTCDYCDFEVDQRARVLSRLENAVNLQYNKEEDLENNLEELEQKNKLDIILDWDELGIDSSLLEEKPTPEPSPKESPQEDATSVDATETPDLEEKRKGFDDPYKIDEEDKHRGAETDEHTKINDNADFIETSDLDKEVETENTPAEEKEPTEQPSAQASPEAEGKDSSQDADKNLNTNPLDKKEEPDREPEIKESGELSSEEEQILE